jgi:HSP20 family protein
LLEYAAVARIDLERRDNFAEVDDLESILDELRDLADATGPSAPCSVALDVVETAGAIEVVMDLPGVATADLTVVFVRGTLAIVGKKHGGICRHHDAVFHLVERASGRFARAVRIEGPFDAARADATLRNGELRVTLPRIEDHRGAEVRIPVRAD